MVAWWRPYITIVVVSACVTLASHPLVTTATVAHLPPTATPDDVDRVRAWLDQGLVPELLLMPLRIAAESLLFSFLLLAFSRAMLGSHSGSFRSSFTIILNSSAIPLLGRTAALLREIVRGETPRMLMVPFSLADLIPGAGDYRLILLLTSLNLFTLWHVGIVTLGLNVLCKCKAWKAFLVAVAAWTVSAAFSIAVLFLLRRAFHFGL
jgi:hypothetical protein